MKFKSENSVYYIEDEILTIAFADSKKPDPNRYLILQREVDNSEIYYYEVNSQMYSNDGGIEKVQINNNSLIVLFNSNQKIYKDGIKILEIDFDFNNEMKEKIIKLFSDSDTVLEVL
ncbi:hypothetical protein IMZ16_05895 [Cruoricaptor ignavus]|uniref:Uncharacterized protein n=1 Tax=Cruoricaptor ignavus TaxID=1118202 RepID=A0A7M1T1C4_9FLAO|nr:Imm10 family immunity protein [Cruoricaptor ignavus]QOR73077.1 hypothetical protein IMZ16_05895 [Cruoricaptor ignavus]